jgi:hypothetical protein
MEGKEQHDPLKAQQLMFLFYLLLLCPYISAHRIEEQMRENSTRRATRPSTVSSATLKSPVTRVKDALSRTFGQSPYQLSPHCFSNRFAFASFFRCMVLHILKARPLRKVHRKKETCQQKKRSTLK